MDFSEIQTIWDAQEKRPAFSLSPEALHRLVLSTAKKFDRTIRMRDTIEIVCLLLISAYFILESIARASITGSILNTWYLLLMVAGSLFVAGYLLVSRRRKRKDDSLFNNSLRDTVKKAISNLERQIRLLGKVFWWYMLPIAIPVAFTIQNTRNPFPQWTRWLLAVAIFAGIYIINRRTVQNKLKPRRKQLTELLAKLNEVESTQHEG